MATTDPVTLSHETWHVPTDRLYLNCRALTPVLLWIMVGYVECVPTIDRCCDATDGCTFIS